MAASVVGQEAAAGAILKAGWDMGSSPRESSPLHAPLLTGGGAPPRSSGHGAKPPVDSQEEPENFRRSARLDICSADGVAATDEPVLHKAMRAAARRNLDGPTSRVMPSINCSTEKEKKAMPLMQRHLLLLLTCFLVLLPFSRSNSVVTHLPGFDGPLPFYLETGYVGVEEDTGTELFYYFVESERSPGTDPVILWLTGGPRCSVFSGQAFEVGPVKFVLEPYSGGLPQLVQNPLSWTKMASIIFLDSPVGSGFSFARDPKGYDVGDYSSSSQVLTFLKKWFDNHPKYLPNVLSTLEEIHMLEW